MLRIYTLQRKGTEEFHYFPSEEAMRDYINERARKENQPILWEYRVREWADDSLSQHIKREEVKRRAEGS